MGYIQSKDRSMLCRPARYCRLSVDFLLNKNYDECMMTYSLFCNHFHWEHIILFAKRKKTTYFRCQLLLSFFLLTNDFLSILESQLMTKNPNTSIYHVIVFPYIHPFFSFPPNSCEMRFALLHAEAKFTSRNKFFSLFFSTTLFFFSTHYCFNYSS